MFGRVQSMIFQSRVTTLFLALFLLVEAGPNPGCGNQRAKSSSAGNTANGNASSSMTNENKPLTEATIWGGPHVRITVFEKTAEIEFDCAHGEIKGTLKGDADGRFDLPGTFAREGGPVRSDASSQAARYAGRIEGDKMTLNVILTGSNEKLDEFTLTKGSQGRLRKCG